MYFSMEVELLVIQNLCKTWTLWYYWDVRSNSHRCQNLPFSNSMIYLHPHLELQDYDHIANHPSVDPVQCMVWYGLKSNLQRTCCTIMNNFFLAFYLALKEVFRYRGRFLLFSLVIALITLLVLFIAALGEGWPRATANISPSWTRS